MVYLVLIIIMSIPTSRPSNTSIDRSLQLCEDYLDCCEAIAVEVCSWRVAAILAAHRSAENTDNCHNFQRAVL